MGKPVSECSMEELRAKEKTLKSVFIVVLIISLFLVAFVIWLMVAGRDFNVGAMVPAMIATMAGLLPTFIGLSTIKKELEKRSEET